MKKNIIPFCMALGFVVACNDESTRQDSSNMHTDSSSGMDSPTTASSSTPATIQSDSATSNFLIKAADGGLAEVEAGKMAESKAANADVKQFASMMVNDHTGANAEVKSLAAKRNVDLPAAPSEEKKKKAIDAGQKSGKAFDKAYMDMMVKDHQKTISLFEKGQSDSKDEEVKSFITKTLPKLKMHLDSAQAIQKRVAR